MQEQTQQIYNLIYQQMLEAITMLQKQQQYLEQITKKMIQVQI